MKNIKVILLMRLLYGASMSSSSVVINDLYVFLINRVVREAAKKKVHPLVAGPLRERGGGKGRAIKEKKTFFFIVLSFKNKNYFTLDNLSKYGHITLKFVGRYFYLVVK